MFGGSRGRRIRLSVLAYSFAVKLQVFRRFLDGCVWYLRNTCVDISPMHTRTGP